MNERLVTTSGSAPENLFIELFSDAFGAEKAAFCIRSIISPIFTRTTAMPTPFLKTVASV